MRAEMSLAAWAYNLRRARAVLGPDKLLAAVRKMAGCAGGPREKAGECVRAPGQRPPLWSDWIRRGWAGIGPARSSPLRAVCFSHRL